MLSPPGSAATSPTPQPSAPSQKRCRRPRAPRQPSSRCARARSSLPASRPSRHSKSTLCAARTGRLGAADVVDVPFVIGRPVRRRQRPARRVRAFAWPDLVRCSLARSRRSADTHGDRPDPGRRVGGAADERVEQALWQRGLARRHGVAGRRRWGLGGWCWRCCVCGVDQLRRRDRLGGHRQLDLLLPRRRRRLDIEHHRRRVGAVRDCLALGQLPRPSTLSTRTFPGTTVTRRRLTARFQATVWSRARGCRITGLTTASLRHPR